MEKLYSTSDIALIAKVSQKIVYQRAITMGLLPTKKVKNLVYYSHEQMQIIKEVCQLEKEAGDKKKARKVIADYREKQLKNTAVSGRYEDMKKLHPLVTDERFFKESYFPDVELG